MKFEKKKKKRSVFALLHFTEIDTQNVSGYTVGTVYMNKLPISAAEMTQYLSSILLQ